MRTRRNAAPMPIPYTTRDAAPSARPAASQAAGGTRRRAARAYPNGGTGAGAAERCSMVCLSLAKAGRPSVKHGAQTS